MAYSLERVRPHFLRHIRPRRVASVVRPSVMEAVSGTITTDRWTRKLERLLLRRRQRRLNAIASVLSEHSV